MMQADKKWCWIWLQWLGQGALKARLLKEVQSIGEGPQVHTATAYLYPYSAAEALSEDFKRLGVAADGTTYLDCLRSLVTGAA